MDIYLLRAFFMWCSIINVGLLLISFIIFLAAGGWVYRVHSRWFKISQEQFYVMWYSMLGFYKLSTLLFCIVPWVSLLIVSC